MEYVARPKKLYTEKIVPAMMEEFGYKSIMQVPKLEKNCCVSRFRCCNCRQKKS